MFWIFFISGYWKKWTDEIISDFQKTNENIWFRRPHTYFYYFLTIFRSKIFHLQFCFRKSLLSTPTQFLRWIFTFVCFLFRTYFSPLGNWSQILKQKSNWTKSEASVRNVENSLLNINNLNNDWTKVIYQSWKCDWCSLFHL